MPQHYITQAERYVRSFLPNDRYEVEHRQLYHDQITPKIIDALIRAYGADDAINLLEYVIEHVEKRRDKAKDRLNRYVLTCYISWLRTIIGQIEAIHAPERVAQARKTFMEAVRHIITRQPYRAFPQV